MTMQASPSLANGEPLAPSRPLLATCFSGLKGHLAVWAQTCADYYRAAALYDALSKLSDAELRRRGLSRSTLAWNIALACDRTSS